MLILMHKRKARNSLFSSDDARRKAAPVQLETEDERCERLRTTRERMAISRSHDTEERRYFSLRYDAVKRAVPTLWFSYCARCATSHEQVLLLMTRRKARKSLFSSDDARRKAARVQLETEDERHERLRTTRERMAISRSQDTEEHRLLCFFQQKQK